ncbi:MAG TPA: ComEC/Rec2 family competence protein [Patescibacteria group bacterium]|nr:ComEC/Rec2 family competence protein [Patescibacteria group bacterium]
MKRYLIWILLISLIIFRYFTTRPVYHNGDMVRITSTIMSDPVHYPTSQYIKIAGLKTYLPLFPEVSYGQRIIVEGVVNTDKLDNDKKLDKPKLIKIEDSKSVGSNFRNSIINFYQKTLPDPEAGLIAGSVLGAKGALTQDFWNQVKNTGVAHVVVASGTNVTFVVSFLITVLTLFLPRPKAIPFVIFGIILYLFISGFDAPLIRAAIMATVVFTANETGRIVSTWRVLILTAGIMLIIKPDWLVDIGFILSFVSTASLMLFERKIRLKLKFLPEIAKEGLSTSLAAQIGVAPILFVTFGQFNILSPIINALVLWTIPFIMILGAMGGAIGLIFPFIGKLILYICYPFAWWFVRVIEIFN